MNHKRGRKKDSRAGCLMCKPWKSNANKGSADHQSNQEKQAVVDEKEQVDELQTQSHTPTE